MIKVFRPSFVINRVDYNYQDKGHLLWWLPHFGDPPFFCSLTWCKSFWLQIQRSSFFFFFFFCFFEEIMKTVKVGFFFSIKDKWPIVSDQAFRTNQSKFELNFLQLYQPLPLFLLFSKSLLIVLLHYLRITCALPVHYLS